MDEGWAGMGGWLGTGKVPPGQHRPFRDARAFARKFGLKSRTEWLDYRKSGRDIPSNPNNAYADAGWAGMG
jgi:hypothetical protein